MYSIVLSGAAIIAFIILFKVYQIISPFNRSLDYSLFGQGDLNGGIRGLVALLMLLSLASSVYMWAVLFYKISTLNQKNTDGYIFFISPGIEIFILPSVFMGILTAMIIVDFLSRVFLKKHYNEICDFLKIYGGFSSPQSRLFLNIFYGFFSLISLIYLVFFMNWYAIFTQDTIVFNNLAGFNEKIYTYKQIEGIYVSTHDRTSGGVEYRKLGITISLDNDNKINTRSFSYSFSKQRGQEFIDFISGKSEKEPIVKKLENQ